MTAHTNGYSTKDRRVLVLEIVDCVGRKREFYHVRECGELQTVCRCAGGVLREFCKRVGRDKRNWCETCWPVARKWLPHVEHGGTD